MDPLLRKRSEVARDRAREIAGSKETGAEQAPDVQVAETPSVDVEQDVPQSRSAAQPAPVEVVHHKDPQQIAVEKTLAGDLVDVYKSLPPNLKPAFKAKGEEVAVTITGWMHETKIVAKKVLRLIKEWLSMIPQVNKHYLEQESKIKTDHIMGLYDDFQRGELE